MKKVTLYRLEHLDGLEKAYTGKWNVIKNSKLVTQNPEQHVKLMKLTKDFSINFADRIRVKKVKAVRYKNRYYSLEDYLVIDE